jgi:hypothetical protein
LNVPARFRPTVPELGLRANIQVEGRVVQGWRALRSVGSILGLTWIASLLSACGMTFLPKQTDTADGGFKSYAELQTAYDHVVPGRTRVSDLNRLGFNSAAPNVEQLSYLGVMDRFMPRANVRYDDVAPQVQACLHVRERCIAYVFRPSLVVAHRTGDTMLDVFGFDRTTVNNGWSAEVTLLIQNDHVTYKVISGKPRIEETHEKVQPLGPLQDLGGAIVPAAERL